MFPMQPIEKDKDGVVRFVPNRIVSFLLEAGPFDMNQLSLMPFDDDEREQLAQLIGYSVSGFGELSYVSDETFVRAAIGEEQETHDTDIVRNPPK